MVHVNCRLKNLGNISRLVFPDNLVPWSVKWDDYQPPDFTSDSAKRKPWSDPDIGDTHFSPKWNELDGNVDRKSHTGRYDVLDGRPLNPEGRTGLCGRGVLGRWGPNHASDPIVTRWKDLDGLRVAHELTKKNILQFCAIQRHDNSMWAIPGGMVDPGEYVSTTLKREFMEEALNILGTDKENAAKLEELVANLFKQGSEVYRGYVDDPRNTDNAWMETVAVNFHDEDGSSVGKFKLEAGDDAKNVRWMDMDRNLALYANHVDFIRATANLHNAHW